MLNRLSKGTLFAGVVLLACVLGASLALAQANPGAPVQKGFASPQAAADALIQAARDFDVPALREILGPGSEDIIASKDQVQDKERALAFVAKANEKNALQMASSKRAILVVGDAEWPLPIPIVKRQGKWYFNTREGRQVILQRRIGANELDAITICRGFVEAQLDYAATPHDDSGINQYAQRILSTPGKQDGLYWENADGTPGGPISDAVAKAIHEGYSTSNPSGYHGYFFKVLKGQGPAAPLGQIDFVIQGVMIGGFALVAAPVEYRVTGVKTFIVSHDGIVYQKDLGPDTANIVKAMERYNPDKTWTRTTDNWPQEATEAAERPPR
ncbi:MAG TPA: DUF2950 domain-containing protein [Terriglobales bacterium]|jgi:hypothetical protein|nr:DUF2950 domain-containing protein [Terriglobales bacterium]